MEEKEMLDKSKGYKINDANVKYFDNVRFNNFDNGGLDTSVVKGQFPTGCADPYIMRYNGMFYLYVTTSGLTNHGLRAWKSKDLLNWKQCQGKGLPLGYVIDNKDEDGRYTQNAYAPEVYYINGKFYMIISPGPEAVSEFRGHRILVSDSPEGPFQAHSEQLDRRIDGTLLIDDDEKIYFGHATPFGITIREINDDIKTLGDSALIKATDGTGAWTEGPGFTKVRGQYYITYTGCHYQTPGYQVIYASCDKLDKTNIETVANSFKRGANRIVLLNCDKDEGHVGLGHSINFMGPDLDSHYICYHNLDVLYEDGMTHRSFNIDRLLIQNGLMTSVQNLKGTIYPKWPFFQSYDEEGFDKENKTLLSKATSQERFSAEYNSSRGGDVKYLFSYQDQNNYCYIHLDYQKHEIKCYQVNNGKEQLLGEGNLRLNYSINNNQTIRVAYDGVLNVYFNNLWKISLKVALKPGRIGYQYQDDDIVIGYSAISDEANGSSDAHEFKQALGEVPANTYLPEKDQYQLKNKELYSLSDLNSEYNYVKEVVFQAKYDYVRYLLNFKETASYGVILTINKKHLGKRLALEIDDEETKVIQLPQMFETKEDVTKVFVPLENIEKGLHLLKIQNVEEEFSLISFAFAPYFNEFKYENELDKSTDGIHFVTPGYQFDKENKELVVEGRRDFAYISHQRLTNMVMEADVRLDSVTEPKGSIGFMVRQNNYAYSDVPKQDFKDANTHIQGYYLEIKPDKVALNKYNFGDVKSYELIHQDFANLLNEYHHYKMEINGNTLKMFMDNKLLFEVSDPLPFVTGAASLYSYRCRGAYRKIKVSNI